MKRYLCLGVLLVAAVLILPAAASAVTLPANGARTTDIPVALSTTDVVGTTYASFRVDGAQVAYVRPVPMYVWGDEGERIVVGYKATAKVAIADGPHIYEVRQGSAVRYHGQFLVDADPIVIDTWFEGVQSTGALYLKIVDNDPTITSNAYEYDRSGTGTSMTNVSSVTANGITTVVRKLTHSNDRCDMLQMLYGGELHGCSVRVTDGYSYGATTLEGVVYPADNMDITWDQYAAAEVCCQHWGDPTAESAIEHAETCWHAPLEWDYGIYGP